MFNSLSNVNKNWELPAFLGEQAVVKVYLADVQKQYVTSFNQQFPIARNKFALHLST